MDPGQSMTFSFPFITLPLLQERPHNFDKLPLIKDHSMKTDRELIYRSVINDFGT
jgi:hypothetical protein